MQRKLSFTAPASRPRSGDARTSKEQCGQEDGESLIWDPRTDRGKPFLGAWYPSYAQLVCIHYLRYVDRPLSCEVLLPWTNPLLHHTVLYLPKGKVPYLANREVARSRGCVTALPALIAEMRLGPSIN